MTLYCGLKLVVLLSVLAVPQSDLCPEPSALLARECLLTFVSWEAY